MERFLIAESEQMRTVLNRLSASVNTLVVVNDLGVCVGTITDGDVRMALLNEADLDASVDSFMNRCPIMVSLSESRKERSKKMAKAGRYGVPLVDDSGKLLEVLFNKMQASGVGSCGHAVCSLILAGGLGSRLRPYTEAIPKPLLRIGSKSILENIIDLHASCGVTRIFLSVNYLGHKIEQMFGDGSRFGVTIEYVWEQERLGTAGPLSLIKDKVSGCEQVLVMNGDLVTNVNLGSIVTEHKLTSSQLTVGVVQKDFENPFGVVTVTASGEVTGIQEKPVYREYVSAGIYCLTRDVLSHVPAGATDMPDVIKGLIDKRQKVTAFNIFESWDDVGFPSDLERLRSMQSK